MIRPTVTNREHLTREVPGSFAQPEDVMKTIKSYPTRVEADLAKIALDAAGVPSVVVGIGVDVEGGAAGVQLLVPDECVEAALMVLEGS